VEFSLLSPVSVPQGFSHGVSVVLVLVWPPLEPSYWRVVST
jgi:hypothetical protein